ncbi:hypothetical protein GCM10011575_45270 [Microlunatus endophyticus]|uniref:DUF4829 domain-containing protein n=1 Tax=Microlunatus endophyticus TaxID=1716077 RepID=A0A917W820_9ACTN|nr:hypothetical protein GCM10011575_45270 [Microlunatus endophyticus]
MIMICTSGAWAFGYRLNLQTASVGVPAPSASPDDVVRAYVAAYNHRDFDTMNALYPSQRRFHNANRHRALGTMSHLKIIDSHHDTTYGQHSRYWAVDVALDYTHIRGADIGYQPGTNGWTYELQQVGPDHAWRIVDHGVG